MAAPMSKFDDGTKAEKNDISDMFKESFKFYKRKKPPPDFSKVIDFSSGSCDISTKIVPYSLSNSTNSVCGVKPVNEWSAYTLEDVPGFIFINNPFTAKGQWFWVEQCLRYYHCKPYVTNLDKHFTVTGNLWEHHRKCEKKTEGEKSSTEKPLMDRLRWSTLGYHHDWDTKHYRADHHCPMPDELVLLCRHVAATVGYPHYDPQAAIINYYHMDSTLAGHTDHSEFDLHSPLISVSFGQPAIFLLGGTSKSQRPHAMYLHSGDIVIMMRESRLAYHAVPRIVAEKQGLPQALTMHDGDSRDQGSEDREKDMREGEDRETSMKGEDRENSMKKGEDREDTKEGEDRENNLTRETGQICDIAKVPSDTNMKMKHQDDQPLIPNSATKSDQSSSEEIVNERIERRMKEMDFAEYEDYMKTCRLNMNVRQVLGAGESFPRQQEQNEVCKKTKVT